MSIFRGIRKGRTAKSQLPPIVVGGCFRSGTSLLRRLLDAHSKIHCPPEVKFFRDLYGDYINDDLSHVRLFSTARQMGLTESELLTIFGAAFVKSHEVAAQARGKSRWADKNPENVLYMKQWGHLLDNRFQFILVVRNPLDTVSSLLEVGFEKTIPGGFEDKVKAFNHYSTAGHRFAHAHPGKSLVIRYEDLVEEPHHTVSRMMEYLGEEYEPSMIDSFNARERQVGLEDPKIASTNTIHSKSTGRWKKELTSEQVDHIGKQCRKVFSWFGYELP